MILKNYYQILGVSSKATQEEIKKAYRLYASKFHPDKHQGDSFFEEKFKEVKEAYDILADPDKRAKYDSLFNIKSDEPKDDTPKDFVKKEKPDIKVNSINPKQEKRNKNILIGIGTIFLFILFMNMGGESGFHVPLAMGFLFWSIRQIFVVLTSYIPD